MNRRAFIRTLAGGAAAVCGIPLPAQKQSTGQVASLPGLLRANTELRELIKPLRSPDKNELLRKMVEFNATMKKEIQCRYIEESLWGKPSDRPASPEYVVMGQLFADKKIRIIGGSGIRRKLL